MIPIAHRANVGQTRTVPETDPFFSKVALLMLTDGVNGQANFVDSSLNKHTVTPVSGAVHSSTQAIYGTTSLRLIPNQYISVPASILQVASSDWTVEAWVYITAYPTNFGGRYVIIGNFWGGNDRGMEFTLIGDGRVHMRITQDGIFDTVNAYSATGVVLNAWNHVACSRRGGSITSYMNGVPGTPTTIAGAVSTGSSPVNIGRVPDTGAGLWYFDGYIRDLRVTKGVSRYYKLFARPSCKMPVLDSYVFPTTNLVMYFKFNGDFVESVNGNNATPTGGTFTYVDGVRHDRAAFKGGTSFRATLPKNANTFLTNNWTMSVWSYQTATNPNQSLIYQMGHVLFYNYYAEYYNGAAQVFIFSPIVPTLNEWHHTVWTKSSVDGGKMYIDGVLVVTNPAATDNHADLSSTVGLFGAATPASGLNSFYGALDEFAMWNRPLTAAEVEALWNRGRGQFLD